MSAAFRLEGADAFENALRNFAKVAARDVEERVKNIAYRLAYSLVMETPQFSGAAASAWRVGIGAPALVSKKPHYDIPPGTYFGRYSPFSKKNRNAEAILDAMDACGAAIDSFVMGAGDIYIANGLPYTLWFEKGLSGPGRALRAENHPHRSVAQVVQVTALSLNNISVLRF